MSLTIKIKPLILVGSSGSGRAALSFRLLCSLPHKFQRVISHTTRKPRQNELNGINFHFTNEDNIMHLLNEQKFITLTKSPNDHYYGLTRAEMQRVIDNHKIPMFKLTLNAYREQILNRNWHFEHYAIYIRVSNLKQLQNRLHYGPFSEKQIAQKMITAQKQDKECQKFFDEDSIIENGLDMDRSYMRLKARLFDLY